MNHSFCRRSFLLLVAMLVTFASHSRAADAKPSTAPDWVDAMRKTHARFTGTHGAFAHFGDSITVSMAFWAGLPYDHKNLPPECEKAFARVKDYMQADCWRNWKGPEFGSQGGMQVTWGEQNVDNVPTLISRDGVHPSAPARYAGDSEETLRNHGYNLRTYITLLAYADVIREILKP